MDDAALAAEQLSLCMNDQRISFALSYASGAIFLYDFLLTFPDEMSHMWRFKRVRAGSILFFIARYGGFTSAIICFLPVDVALGNVRTCMRLVTIVSSDAVLAVRTWAIWERRKSVLLLLLCTALGAIGGAVFILEKDASTSKMSPAISPLLPNLCSYIESDVTNLWSIPYFLTIMYETITLVLTLAQILRWRKRIPASVRSSLSDALWKDGVTYFAFMLVLSIINIGLVFQVTLPQLRSGGSQLQTCLHSMVATRIILSMAGSSSGPKNIEDGSCMTLTTLQPIHFRSSSTRLSYA
ncbi:hypothetical protein BDN71DRAFT_971890 [Pleurotus eryngii]|uniref:DUF6533 domain-containing protein n=1 Tax=Pleurotus eryngii TaxID=5323 RepID=A0A9P6D7X7_PLEER|nr:hypothetical protein BDN71DRAFT_971890 [Pleurotus eryngii]